MIGYSSFGLYPIQNETRICSLERSKGFTLIELVMVLAIIAILAIEAVPRFFSTFTYNQQVYYDEVLNSLRYARKLAVGQGNHIQVSVTANSITLQRRIEGSACNTGTTFQPVTDPGTSTSGYVKTAPNGVTLTFSADWPIYFNGLGQAIRASNCSVIASDTITVVGGNTVTVLGETGFVQ